MLVLLGLERLRSLVPTKITDVTGGNDILNVVAASISPSQEMFRGALHCTHLSSGEAVLTAKSDWISEAH